MNTNVGRVGTDQPMIGPFVKGLVSAVAVGAVVSSGDSTDSGVLMMTIGMGVAAAVFALGGAFLRRPADVLYDGLAVVLFVPTVASFVRGGCNGELAPAVRWAALLLLVAVALLTVGASILTLHKPIRLGVGVALLGAVQALDPLVTVTTFLTGSGTSDEWLALAVMVPSAFVFGWFVVRMPGVVTAVAGTVLGMYAIFIASTQAVCGSGNAGGLVVILLYCGAYFATRAVAGPFTGRRTR
ncbi:hypothetical protein [Mycolicibacterium sp. F2034L]|uniref:hypothetical protein n=1 Tax=Mycolicibacterium sp. F2034L TaxID=2926422 RepID=UPI001FF68B1F|nr:hypothetical protein [Mycolicibacterium sp. F2034L]MCK0177621.1 hypothetical protein [Mycolicibacterium sp. F2034L]